MDKLVDNLLKDKKGGEKYLSIWWFLILVIIGIGIVVGVLIFYSADVDVREIEAEILYDKITGCLIKQGFLINGFFDKDFDVLKECGLNEDVFVGENFYFKISIRDEFGNVLREDIAKGVVSFETECRVQEEDEKGKKITAKHFPKCARKKENVLYYNSSGKKIEIKKAVLEILAASNQQGEKIPITE